jgi:hypothetical protein
MPIPRYKEKTTGIPYEIFIFCPDCGWAMTKDHRNTGFPACRACGSINIRTLRLDYPERK